MDKLLYALLGFFLGIASSLIIDHVKERRRQRGLLELIKLEIGALRDACREAEEHELWDSTGVESLAEFIQRQFVEHPDQFLAAHTAARPALARFYVEVCAVLGLLELFRQQGGAGRKPSAIGPGTYKGFANRCDQLLRELS